jgi:hypothetical protein
MRQFGAQRTFFEPPGELGFNSEPAPVDFNQLLMLAIARAVVPPLVHRRSVLQPMQIVVLAPDSLPPANASYETPAGLPQPLPRALLSAPSGPNAVPQLRQVESTVSHRKLFADPGLWRVVWWGEFKEILARQLAHPERLRDTYRLPCYVQVIETERTVAIEELAALYKSDKCQTPLYVLTDEIAAKLDLVLPLRAAPSHDAPRAPSTLLAHERVFRLVAANDPTIDVVANGKNKLTAQTPKTEVTAKPATPVHTAVKATIPDRFIKDWEFKISREEALYDMNAKPALGSLIRNFCRQLRVIKLRREFQKWQALLAGRSVDEQLWAVHPPCGMLTDPVVRNWAQRTLEQGGYDAQKMIAEWEVFWRRRGF